MMGVDRFKEVLCNIDYLVSHRHRLTEHDGTMGFALPWVVPHLQRREQTYEDINSFYDRWQHTLGAAVIADPPRRKDGTLWLDDSLTPAVTPTHVMEHDRRRCMTILCDGSVPIDWSDFTGNECIGSIPERCLPDLWHALIDRFKEENS
jgi:hypothetical protein